MSGKEPVLEEGGSQPRPLSLEAKRRYSLIEQNHREAAAKGMAHPSPIPVPRGLHHTELPEAKAGEPLAAEWNFYRQHVAAWLAEGREGQLVVLVGEMIVGFYPGLVEAWAAGRRQRPNGPFFVHRVQGEEPVLRIRGINLPWTNSHLR